MAYEYPETVIVLKRTEYLSTFRFRCLSCYALSLIAMLVQVLRQRMAADNKRRKDNSLTIC